MFINLRPTHPEQKKYNDEKANKFGPLHGGESAGFHRHMISVVVFSYSWTIEIMLVDYAVTEMGSLDDYLHAAPQGKSMRRNGITTFLLHVSQCTIFNKTNRVKTTIIAKAIVEVILFKVRFQGYKRFANYLNFEEARKHFPES